MTSTWTYLTELFAIMNLKTRFNYDFSILPSRMFRLWTSVRLFRFSRLPFSNCKIGQARTVRRYLQKATFIKNSRIYNIRLSRVNCLTMKTWN